MRACLASTSSARWQVALCCQSHKVLAMRSFVITAAWIWFTNFWMCTSFWCKAANSWLAHPAPTAGFRLNTGYERNWNKLKAFISFNSNTHNRDESTSDKQRIEVDITVQILHGCFSVEKTAKCWLTHWPKLSWLNFLPGGPEKTFLKFKLQ